MNFKLYKNNFCNQVKNNSNIISYYCGKKKENINFKNFSIDTKIIIKNNDLVKDEFLRYILLKTETENNNKLYFFNKKKQILIIGRTAHENKKNESIKIDEASINETDNIISVVKRVTTHSSSDDLNNIYANDNYWLLFKKIVEKIDTTILTTIGKQILNLNSYTYNFYGVIVKVLFPSLTVSDPGLFLENKVVKLSLYLSNCVLLIAYKYPNIPALFKYEKINK